MRAGQDGRRTSTLSKEVILGLSLGRFCGVPGAGAVVAMAVCVAAWTGQTREALIQALWRARGSFFQYFRRPLAPAKGVYYSIFKFGSAARRWGHAQVVSLLREFWYKK